MSKYLFLKVLLIGLIILIADQLSKALVYFYIPLSGHASTYPYGGIAVFKNFLGVEFSIGHATNKGAAWGMLADFQVYLLILRIVLIVGLVVYCACYNTQKKLTLPLTLIIAGATGNVLDYFIYGHVVDMFHFIFWGYDYPIFNIADSAIFIGIAWLFFLSWPDKSSVKNHL